MELVILKARAQLNRLVLERRASASKERSERAGGGGGARAAGRERGMAPARPAPATAAPWLNATLAFNLSRINSTFDTDYELLNASSSDEHDNHWFCAKWTSAQQDLFQAANLCFAIAFLAPKSFKQSILVLRALIAAGAVLMGMWAGAEVCAPDVLAWSLALVLVNSIHTVFLIVRMRVSCDETVLHYIQPYQFVDSPEWEANREQSDDVFQVTVIAEEVCTCVCWPRMRLERVLRHRPALKVVLDCLIGKDITHKLYAVSEGLSAGVSAEHEGPPAHLTRSASVDAVHEGARGRLRSVAWRAKSSSSGRGSSYWQPVVARQFLRQSPFGRSVVPPPRLLTQTSSASLQPPALRRSPPRRTTSCRRSREVKFAEVAIAAEPAV
ncbi:blood vessel epicardial substance-like isoform X2 [Maniola hyperantus]|uniref:blood vessel epicardial substance-like isoform X2 n=1 Tax=Aphantopus hyperantus TaxID=2795564 RepID=UPI0037489205